MDFNDSPEEAAFRAEVRAWIEANATLLAGGGELYSDADIERGRRWQRAKADAGYGHMVWPREYGGRGGSWIEAAIFDQEERRVGRPFNYFSVGIGQCLPCLIKFGTSAQRDLIAQTLRGEMIWCQLFSEPDAGVDLAAVRTTAQKTDEGWRINGQKLWTSGAQVADYGILLARTDASLVKHKGLTFFLVDMSLPGIDIRPIRQMSGESEFNEVYLDDLLLPEEAVLGEVNAGWSVAMYALSAERFKRLNTRMPSMVSVVERLGDDVTPDTAETALLDSELGGFLADKCAQENLFARLMTDLSRGGEPGSESSVMKLATCRSNQALLETLLHSYSGVGEIVDREDEFLSAVQDAWQWAPGMRIAGGSDEILLNIIGERVLGLPGEPRLDKDIPFSELPR